MNKESSVENVVVLIIIGYRQSGSISVREAKPGHNIKYDTVVKTDNYTSYSKIKDQVWCHIPQKVSPKEAGKVLPWLHTMIANAKRTLLGIHHMISNKFPQNYLDEFFYKVNRRNYGDQLFDRLLIACFTSNYQIIVNQYR